MTDETKGGPPLPPYTVIRSARRLIALEVGPKGLIVRAPAFASEEEIAAAVRKNALWIARQTARLEEARRRLPKVERLTEEELRRLAEQAKKVIPERVAHYAPLVGVTYSRITIRNQRTKWGSCSSKGGLNFNCLLMLTPPEVIDSVVAHELCHRRHMDHSPAFYAELYRVCPDYRECRAWLKEHGAVLLARVET
jgi:predicted metal-dependent hydrolase